LKDVHSFADGIKINARKTEREGNPILPPLLKYRYIFSSTTFKVKIQIHIFLNDF